MAIWQTVLPDGRITYSVYVQAYVHGRRIQKRRDGIATRREAKDFESALKADFLLQKGKAARVTWAHWVHRSIQELRVTLMPSTIFNYERQLKKWANPYFGERFIDEIHPRDIHAIIHDHMKDVSPSTQRSVLKMISKMMTRAMEEGLIARNPAVPVKVRIPEPKKLVLNATEAQKLLQEAKNQNHRFYVLWAFALFTGMRSGELYALRWSDIDLENGRISVNRSWSALQGYGPTKSRKNRVVPISAELRHLLAELALTRGGQALGEDFVLPHLAEWTSGEQARITRAFCRSIGITPVKFHDLRATFTTQLLLRGVSLAQVMSIVGHSQLKTTNGYLRVAGTDLEGATDKLTYSLPRGEMAKVIELAAW